MLNSGDLYQKTPNFFGGNRSHNGAGEEIRTLDFNLGKVALYH